MCVCVYPPVIKHGNGTCCCPINGAFHGNFNLNSIAASAGSLGSQGRSNKILSSCTSKRLRDDPAIGSDRNKNTEFIPPRAGHVPSSASIRTAPPQSLDM